jgi:hypothetical protein
MLEALRRGFTGLGRNWGLVVVAFSVNIALALLVALPLASQLERDLDRIGVSASMMYGFDHDWWTHWSEDQEGYTRSLAPDVFGTGFAPRNVDLLLRGSVPGRVFREAGREAQAAPSSARRPRGLDPLLVGLGVLYLVVQTFLTGGLLGVFRAPQGGWTLRGLIHGSGFYFGRLIRVGLLGLGLVGIVFAANVPFARWVDGLAREAVSEETALALFLGRRALLLLAIVLVHMVASFARVIVVQEERQSAALAFVSSAGFCGRNLVATAGQYGVVLLLALVLLGAWASIDARLLVVGWKSQLVAFALFQVFLLSRIGLRLALLASQLELHRAQQGRR